MSAPIMQASRSGVVSLVSSPERLEPGEGQGQDEDDEAGGERRREHARIVLATRWSRPSTRSRSRSMPTTAPKRAAGQDRGEPGLAEQALKEIQPDQIEQAPIIQESSQTRRTKAQARNQRMMLVQA
jgi:hypothetical protein